jgi:methyl-accepting chemotaxis protein
MSLFLDLRLRWKLLGAFGAVCLIMAVVGWIGVSTAQGIQSRLDDVGGTNLPSVAALGKAQSNLLLGQRSIRSAILATDPKAISGYVDTGRKAIADSSTAWNQYMALPMSDDEKPLAAPVGDALKSYNAFFEQAAAEAISNTPDNKAKATDLILTQAAAPAAVLNNNLPQLVDLNIQQGDDQMAQSKAEFDRSLKILIGALVGGVIVALALGLLLARTLVGSVNRVAATARQIAENDLPSFLHTVESLADGDLTGEVSVSAARIEIDSKDELGSMAADFNAMIERLQDTGRAFARMSGGLCELVGDLQSSSNRLAETATTLGSAAGQTGEAVQQVNSAIQTMASGAQTTSSSAQETNASVGQLRQAVDGIARGADEQAKQIGAASSTATQMAAGVDQVAANAANVAAASQQTRAAAEHGSNAVRETTTAMAEIHDVVTAAASKVHDLGKLGEKIGAVVETIDDIAEQTNLLALNAAIEAARAGEHGRGFAVVADEVRKLAERSSRETKAIAELIRQVQAGTQEAVGAMQVGSTKVEHGSAKASQAGVALEEILRAVDATVRQVTEIATSAGEMSKAARAVNDAMTSISAVVEENTAATEEMAAQSVQVSDAIANIASVAEEQSATSEEVSASAEEMSAQVEEMSAQAQELAATADQLQRLASRFRLEGGAGTSNVVHLRRAA